MQNLWKGDSNILHNMSMKEKKPSRLLAYISGAWLVLSALIVFNEPLGDPWPWTLILIVSAYVHGVAWGYVWRDAGKLTWL